MKTYNWEGVNPDGYFLDKLEPIPSALPSFQKLFQVSARSEERFSRNAETDLVCRLLLEKKKARGSGQPERLLGSDRAGIDRSDQEEASHRDACADPGVEGGGRTA